MCLNVYGLGQGHKEKTKIIGSLYPSSGCVFRVLYLGTTFVYLTLGLIRALPSFPQVGPGKTK